MSSSITITTIICLTILLIFAMILWVGMSNK